MKLQVLVDNNTYIDHYYLGEPGVSYYVEIDDKKILFDAGYSDIMIRNAHSLGVDLKKITHIVLSHGHDDHSKGLKYLFSQFSLPNATLVAHPGCFAPGGSRPLHRLALLRRRDCQTLPVSAFPDALLHI